MKSIQQLREAEPRAFDAMVCEKVMGWERVDVDYHTAQKKKGWVKLRGGYYGTPSQAKHEVLFDDLGIKCVGIYWLDPKTQRVRPENECTPDNGGDIEFHPHENATADLEAHRVACAWIFSKRQRYLMELNDLWRSRYESGGENVAVFQLVSKYQIGDYSQAALEALEECSNDEKPTPAPCTSQNPNNL